MSHSGIGGIEVLNLVYDNNIPVSRFGNASISYQVVLELS